MPPPVADHYVSHRSLGANADREYNDDLTNLVPTLYIGLGGSGKNTLMRFRKALFDEYHSPRPQCCRFILIDGDAPKKNKVDGESEEAMTIARFDETLGEFIGCSISESVYKSTLDRVEMEHDARFKSWLHPNFRTLIPAKAVVDGAGTYRQAGRFQFFLNYERIRDQITTHISEMFNLAAAGNIEVFPGQMGNVDPHRLEVVIVAGLAGGTGSGMFIDLAYLIQDIISDGGIQALNAVSAHVTLIAYLPTIFSRKSPGLALRYQQNAYAALLEMEQYCTFRQEDAAGEDGESTGAEFRVNWTGVNERVIKRKPWDACYLIDDINDRQPGRLPDAEELYQMVADYLFLDFGNSPFAIAKRSTRSNHSQLLDKRIQSAVLGEVDIRGQPQLVELFSNLYGSTFSSFGLAEIQIDRERINRAASYRLAISLLEDRWINKGHAHGDDVLKSWAEADLETGTAPEGDMTGTVQFGPDDLWRELFRDAEGTDWVSRIGSTLDGLLQKVEPDKLRRMLDDFDSSLESAEGRIHKTMLRRYDDLGGKDKTPGDLRNRLSRLARARFAKHGVKPTLDLLAQYASSFGEFAQQCHDACEHLESLSSNARILERLDDALRIPFFTRWIASNIEYPRAVGAATKTLPQRCRREALERLETLNTQLQQFVNAPQKAKTEVFTPLRATYVGIQQFLEEIREKLVKNYEHLSRHAGSDRKISLLPNWEDKDYDDEIAVVLRSNDEVMSNKEGTGPNWKKAESAILGRLLVGRDGRQTLPDLVDHWLEECSKDHDFRDVIVDRLAHACRELLGDGIGLKNFAGGNVVEYLASIPNNARGDYAKKLIDAAAPYFPARDVDRVQNFRMFCRNILGRSNGQGAGAAATVQRIETVIKQAATVNSHNHVLDRIHDVDDLEPTRVVLVRELAGFPLSLYSRLRILETAYLDKGLNDQRKTCHIKYRETYEDLPDIMIVEDEKYRAIRENVDYVFYGLCLRFIERDDDGMFCARIISPTIGEDPKPLGMRLNRIVKHACNSVVVRGYLQRRWERWRTQVATPRHFAVLYNALQRSRDLVRSADKPAPHQVDRPQNPVLNCLLRLLTATTLDLRKTDEGRQWLKLLREPNNEEDSPADIKDWEENSPALFARIEQLCLRLPGGGERVPIYQIDDSRIEELQLPVKAPLPAPGRPDAPVGPSDGG